jgi:hypothetical protein
MDQDLIQRIRLYLNTDQPLGPTDAYQIKDAEVAASLFDPHNEAFNLLLRRNISVVVGRRGSGKTALLNSYLYRPFLQKNSLAQKRVGDGELDLNDYSIVISILGNRMFEKMQEHVAGTSGVLRPIESVIEDWANLVTDYVILRIWESERTKFPADEQILKIEAYLNGPDAQKKAEAYRQVWGPSFVDAIRSIFIRSVERAIGPPTQEEALQACARYLAERNTRAVAIFDSLDEYQTGDRRADRTVGALLRFVAQFNLSNDRIKIKLGLPAEIFPEVRRASANPLKDFFNFDQVKWTSVELAQIAAYRYRLFIQLYDEEHYPKVAAIDLNNRDGARKFWKMFFPEPQINRYGHQEGAMTYMIRHTHLLPRQLFRILHRVIRESNAETGGYRMLTKKAVDEAIVDMESIVAGEIIQGFDRVYPKAEDLCKTVFGNFPTVFSYDQLENKWRRAGRAMMREIDPAFELVHFTEMLLRMGVIGVVESETERYIEARFAYHLITPFSVGEKLIFAMHPIFSRFFSCSENPQRKSILPQGASLELGHAS